MSVKTFLISANSMVTTPFSLNCWTGGFSSSFANRASTHHGNPVLFVKDGMRQVVVFTWVFHRATQDGTAATVVSNYY